MSEEIIRKGKNMKVIAKRTNALIRFYGFGLVAFGVELLLDSKNLSVIVSIFLIIMIILFGGLIIYELIRPKEIISINKSKGIIYLHLDDIRIKVSSLKSVTYDKTYSWTRYATWGKIILKTRGDEYEYNYVSNVVKVAEELNRLISIEKIKKEE